MRPTAILVLAVVAGFIVLVLRRPGSITHPGLWAEDGSVFLHDALTRPLLSAITASYAGYLHLVPRLLAAAAARLPLAWTPTVYATSSLAIATLALTPALSHRLAWLVPSTWGRVALFGVLVLMPSVDEVHGVVADLHWYFGITLVLLALSADPRSRPGRAGEAGALALLGLTGPFSILTAPIFWLRGWREKTRHSIAVASIVTAAAIVQVVVLAISHDTAGGTGGIAVGTLATAWGLRLGGTAVFGERLLHDLWAAGLLHGAFWLVSFGFLALAAVSLLRLPWTAVLTLVIAMATAVASTTIRLKADLVALDNPADGGRYYVIPIGVLAITVVAALARTLRSETSPMTPWRLALAVLPAALLVQAMVFDARLPARPDVRWADTVRCVQAHRTCTVQLDPPGWTMQLPPQ